MREVGGSWLSIVLAAELRATSSSVFELVLKRAAKRQIAHGLACQFQGPYRYPDGG